MKARLSICRDLTPADVAAMLGKSRNSIVALIKTGELRATNVCNAGSKRPMFRIRPEDVERWLHDRQVKPLESPAGVQPRRYVSNGIAARLRAAKQMKDAKSGQIKK